MLVTEARLPESEQQWKQAGRFQTGTVLFPGKSIRFGFSRGSTGGPLVTMVGGIPREPERRHRIPLINKLFGTLALELQKDGVSGLMYNQPATGASGGDWDRETIASRTDVLVKLANMFGSKYATNEHMLIGSSAGAYMAAKAAELLANRGRCVSKLVLLSPAAYPEAAETVPYGNAFTDILTQPWDISASPVFAKLQRFIERGGSVLLCFFEDDDPPIPARIQEYYRTYLRRIDAHSGQVSFLTIPGVAHNFRRIEKKRGSVVDDDAIRRTAGHFSTFLR